MTDSTEAANGVDKANGGTNGHAVPVPTPAPSRDRPSIPAARPSYERTHAVGASELDAIGSLSSRSGAKLQSTTPVMNAFMAHVTTVCGRAHDQLTENDVTILGGMLSSLDKLEITQRRGLSS